MNKPEQQTTSCLQKASSQPAAAQNAATINHPSAVVLRMKNVDTHPCITIKWSLDSVRRRSADRPPVAAGAAAAAGSRVAGDALC